MLGRSDESTAKRICSVPFGAVAVAGPARATCGRVGFFNFGGGGTVDRFAIFDVAGFEGVGFGGAGLGVAILGAEILGVETLGFAARGLVILGAAGGGANFATGAGSFGGGANRRFAGVTAAIFGGVIFGGVILGAISFGAGGGTAALRVGLAARFGGAKFGGESLGAFACAGFAIEGGGGGVRVVARAVTAGLCFHSGGKDTEDFGGSLGGGSKELCLLAGVTGVNVAVMVPVDCGKKGRSILGRVGSGPSLSNTVRSTITLGRFDPGE